MKALRLFSSRPLIAATFIIAATTVAAAPKIVHENDAVADLRRAKISLTDAVARSQSQFGGQAVRAELDGESGKPVYDIELVRGNTVHEVRLDAVSGAVLSSKVDEDDDADEKDSPAKREPHPADAHS